MLELILSAILLPVAIVAIGFSCLFVVVCIATICVGIKEALKKKDNCQFFDNSKKI